MSGSGDRRRRQYVAMWQLFLPGPRIISQADRDQGWSWRDLDEAINTLPPGEERTRQRAHFGALSLLAVLIQHGDRKPEQQALYCLEPADPSAGGPRSPDRGRDKSTEMLYERPGTSACPQAAAVIMDVGATFGGAGRTSNATTAKMHLESWRRKTVFEPGGDACRGELTISMAAGSGGEGHPVISEEGRLFLVEQLHRLTTDHVRALFTAARVDKIQEGRSSAHSDGSDPIEAWVAAFQDKVHQIESRHCQQVS
jgi:hypothetical protein